MPKSLPLGPGGNGREKSKKDNRGQVRVVFAKGDGNFWQIYKGQNRGRGERKNR